MTRALAIAATLALLIVERPAQPVSLGAIALVCHHYTAAGTLTPEWLRICKRIGVRLA